jgi:ferric-dicitrate binding protein FerR (iron transport regulator)
MDDQRSQIDIDIVERDDMVVVVVEGEVDLSAASEFAAGLALAAGSQATASASWTRPAYTSCFSFRSPRGTTIA